MTDLPSDLALLGWTRRGTQLFAPDGPPMSICMNSFPPPECYNVARDQPWYRALIAAQREDAARPKPKKAKRVKRAEPEPEPVQEMMQL